MTNAVPNISCPQCGAEVDIDQALSKELEGDLRKEIEKDSKIQADTLVKERTQEISQKLKSIEDSLGEKNREVEKLRENELKLLKESREVEEKSKSLDLQIEREVKKRSEALDKEQNRIYQEKMELREQEHKIKEQALRKNIEDLSKQIKAGSQQLQGEALELVLEDKLKLLFPGDLIAPVEKGVKGADLIQTVRNSLQKSAGQIIWEFKNTKNWSPSWIAKLKEDQRAASASLAVIVTSALPKDMNNFGLVEGVWVCSPGSLEGLATALRAQLISAHSVAQSNVGKNQKMEDIYRYLCGDGFKQRIEAIVEAFQTMQSDLQKERAVTERNFSKREKQISQVLTGTVGMYGDLEALVGQDILEIETISFPAKEKGGEMQLSSNLDQPDKLTKLKN